MPEKRESRTPNLVSLALWVMVILTVVLWLWNQYIGENRGKEQVNKPLESSVPSQKERYELLFLPDAQLELLIPISIKVTSSSPEGDLKDLLQTLLSLKHPAIYNPFRDGLKVLKVESVHGELSVVLNSGKLLAYSYGSELEMLAVKSIALTVKYSNPEVTRIALKRETSEGEELISTSHYGPLEINLEDLYVNPVRGDIERPLLVFYALRGSDLLVPLTFDSSEDPLTLILHPPAPYNDLRPLTEVYSLKVERRDGKVTFTLRRRLYRSALQNLARALTCTFGPRGVELRDPTGKSVKLIGKQGDLRGINPVEL